MKYVIIIALVIALVAMMGPMREAGRQSRLEEKQAKDAEFEEVNDG